MSNVLSFLQNNASEIGSSVSGIADAFSPQAKVNQEFLNRNKNLQTQLKRINSVSGGLSSAAISSGNPVAMGIGAAMKIGDALTKSSVDEYGVVKDSAKAIVGGIVNPIQGISTLLGQGERKDMRDRFVNRGIASNMSETAKTGNAISNSLPDYKSPGYGKRGMKLMTKFSSRNGKAKF